MSADEVEPVVQIEVGMDDVSDFNRKYDIGERLGAGASGCVYRCCLRADPSQKFAVKIVKRDADTKATVISALRNEIRVLKQLTSDFCVKLIEDFDEPTRVCLVMELIEGTTLLDVIKDKRCRTEQIVANILMGVLLAIRHLHQQNTVHRDIKPENIMLTTDNVDDPELPSKVKLIDFGLADTMPITSSRSLTQGCGTPWYIAPEIVKHSHFRSGPPYGAEVDLWSIGIVGYVMLSGNPPFAHRLYSKTFDLINAATHVPLEGERWDKVSADGKDFLTSLLQVDPAKRANVTAALGHVWLTNTITTQMSSVNLSLAHPGELFQGRKMLRKVILGAGAVSLMSFKAAMTKLEKHANSGVVEMLTTTEEDLTTFDLSGNFVNVNTTRVALRTIVAKHKNITTVNLAGNGIDDDAIKDLCSVVSEHPSITEIDLSNNPFTDTGVDALYKLVFNNQRLRKIKFDPYYPGSDPDKEGGLMPFVLKRIQNRLEERVEADELARQLARRSPSRSPRRGSNTTVAPTATPKYPHPPNGSSPGGPNRRPSLL